MSASQLTVFQDSFRKELSQNILPYWTRLKTETGLVPALDSANQPIPGVPLSLILVSRLLWTYSRAYKRDANPERAAFAAHAKAVLVEQFADPAHGGFHWTLDASGHPADRRKQCYGQAFCIYALSEHFDATGDADSLELARATFALLEEKAWEPRSGGYLETFRPDWTPLETMRLGDEDRDAPKTMNNHLHLIEAYANLLRVDPDERLRQSCRRLLRVIADRIILPDTPRFGLFYDMDWKLVDTVVSPGHDIEGSWLLWEAAEIVGDSDLAEEMKSLAVKMAERVLQTGLDANGGVFDEFHLDHPRSETKSWWPQAEGVVGFFNAYQLSGDERYLDASLKLWEYIQSVFVDRENGEWIWGVRANGSPMNKEKAGPWKASYHNGRACFEMIDRIEQTLARTQRV